MNILCILSSIVLIRVPTYSARAEKYTKILFFILLSKYLGIVRREYFAVIFANTYILNMVLLWR